MSKKLAACKVCGEKIARNARVCPHCGAKQKRHTTLGIVLTILGIAIIACALNGPGNHSNKPSTFGVGQPAEADNIIVTLNSVSENSGGNFMTPSDGKVFVVCEFTIENNSDKEIGVSSPLSFDAYIDDYATTMNLNATLSTTTPQLDGNIAPGKKMNGVIGYEAEPDWSNIEVRFTANVWSGKDYIFTYSK